MQQDADGIPVIDFSGFAGGDETARRRIATAIDAAFSRIGFIVLTGHGIAPATIEAAYAAGKGFFALPLAEKERALKPSARVNRGYSGFRSRTVGKQFDREARPSLQEGFAMGMMDVPDDPYFTCDQAGTNFAPNIWPAQPAGFQPAMRAYYAAVEDLAARLMRAFATGLGIAEDFFADKMDRHISTLRLVRYPVLEAAPEPGSVRAGAHTDTGTLTILRIDEALGGLQVQRRDGRWVDVQAVPDSFVINVGDMMMRWTNDRWTSTVHRVVNPPVGEAQADRLSIVFFNQPNYDAVVACIETCQSADNPPRHPPVTSGEHRLKRYAETYGFALPAKPAAA
jgi:isopenicillin N synthase-like dioxygenase